MSDTPETDDLARGNHVVPTEWAQQLERERNEARQLDNDQTNYHLKMLEYKRERDEAREELHDIRLNLGDDADGYTLLHAVCVIQNERDEAQEEVKLLKAILDLIKKDVS